MENMQIAIKTPKLPNIDFDFENAKKILTKEVESFKALIVTEDTIPSCKKSRAELNKIKTSINNDKKKLKKEWNAPYIEVEDKVKELMTMCDEGLEYLDNGLSVYKTARVATKAKECKDLLEQKISESELLKKFAIDLHLPEGFTNSSMSLKAVGSAIDIQIMDLMKDQEQEERDAKTAKDHIASMNSAFSLKVPLTEKDFERGFNEENFNLSRLLDSITSRAQAQQRVENTVIEETIKEKEEVVSPRHFTAEPAEMNVIEEIEPTRIRRLDINCSQSQFKIITEYLSENDIDFDELSTF